jgi:hypothetical protein
MNDTPNLYYLDIIYFVDIYYIKDLIDCWGGGGNNLFQMTKGIDKLDLISV